MTGISTHVLDTSLGRPAEGVPVELALRSADGGWQVLLSSATDADGRCQDLPPVQGTPTVRLLFDTAAYFAREPGAGAAGRPFLPEVSVVFCVEPGRPHCHVPLLLNPYGYSVYRGS